MDASSDTTSTHQAPTTRKRYGLDPVPAGLRGVVVAETTIGSVRGAEGFYHYRDHDAVDVARRCSVEQAWGLLLDGVTDPGLDIGVHRVLDESLLDTLAAVAERVDRPYQLLQIGLPLLQPDGAATLEADAAAIRRRAVALAAAAPTVLAAFAARRDPDPRPVLNGDPGLSHAADWYRMATGRPPTPWQERVVRTYLVATLDHGFNASTFATRAVVSTGTDVASALMAGVGSLAGPLHGGAPALALSMVRDIASAERAAPWVRDRVSGGAKIMGFGHAVYRTEDPRSRLLRELALEHGGELVERAVEIEAAILAELQRLKPDAVIQTNVEYYAGIVLHLAGLPDSLFTPSFTVSRMIGWTAHLLEQVSANRVIRPSARYVGPEPATRVPVGAGG